MSIYNISNYLNKYLDNIQKFNLNDRSVLDYIVFKNNDFGTMDTVINTKEDYHNKMNEYYNTASIQEPLPYISYINGYSELFILLYRNGPDEYFKKYVPEEKRNEEYLNSLKKLYEYKEFIRIFFNLLNPTNKNKNTKPNEYNYIHYIKHDFSIEYKYLFNHIINHFLKYNNIYNLKDNTDKNEIFNYLSINKYKLLKQKINEEYNKDLLNKLINELISIK